MTILDRLLVDIPSAGDSSTDPVNINGIEKQNPN